MPKIIRAPINPDILELALKDLNLSFANNLGFYMLAKKK